MIDSGVKSSPPFPRIVVKRVTEVSFFLLFFPRSTMLNFTWTYLIRSSSITENTELAGGIPVLLQDQPALQEFLLVVDPVGLDVLFPGK